METNVFPLEISGCKEKSKIRCKEDFLAGWLKELGCCNQVEKSVQNNNKLSNDDLRLIRKFLSLPLSDAEKIIFSDLIKTENGLNIKRVGTLDRFVDLKLARKFKAHKRLKATEFAKDKRVQFILGIN